jgi:hypothetical protein
MASMCCKKAASLSHECVHSVMDGACKTDRSFYRCRFKVKIALESEAWDIYCDRTSATGAYPKKLTFGCERRL